MIMGCDGGALIWFRDDLRIGDQPALTAAIVRGKPVAGLYILNASGTCGARAPGAAGRWKLHGALQDLRDALATLNIPLILRSGDPSEALDSVVRSLGITAVFWSRRYEPDAVTQDKAVMAALTAKGIAAKSFNGKLLAEPWTVKTQAGGWFKVFTPFCHAARASHPDLRPLPAPDAALPWEAPPDRGDDLETWGLTPTSSTWTEPDWTEGLSARWPGGEGAAKARMGIFLEDGFKGYKEGRNVPSAPHVSGLSPYLATGEISPRQARQAVLNASEEAGGALDADFETFERELYWRDFSHSLLFFGDDITAKNHQPKFDAFPWSDDAAAFKAWTKGKTGYPIVDAGMRELWRTGYMHNRIRMITASFLTKHLLIDWRRGERWFWTTLVDADPASNPANWQWVAGSGADAAPYFRIFNPMTQGEKFDPDGSYVRAWVPELSGMPDKYLHAPWTAPESVLKTARVALGKTYPRPIVDHKAARDRALSAYKEIK
jgi:deoxyribodipyrimidine photo-lyase